MRPAEAKKGARRGATAPVARSKTAAEAATPRLASDADMAVGTMLARDVYVRERHLFLVRMTWIQGICNVVCIIAIAGLALRSPRPVYFATGADGRIMRLVPLSQPIESVSEISNWVGASLSQALTFGFATYRSDLSKAQVNFTPEGWHGFLEAMHSAGVEQSVIANKYQLTATLRGAAVLINQGVLHGVAFWQFQVPLVVTYQSAEQQFSQNWLVTATVVRMPQTQNPRGLGIESFVARES